MSVINNSRLNHYRQPDVTIRNEWIFNFESITQSWRNTQAENLVNHKNYNHTEERRQGNL